VCISGNAFSKNKFVNYKFLGFMIEKISNLSKQTSINDQENKYLFCELIPKFITEKTRIFYRMSPDDKVKLINFFKLDPNAVVCMCGDGANDCGALLSADIGISLNDFQSTKRITSHFSYRYDSIKCIEIILRNGRACFENNIMILKYIILYSALQLTICLCLLSIDRDMSDEQYFFQDCLISLISCILAAK